MFTISTPRLHNTSHFFQHNGIKISSCRVAVRGNQTNQSQENNVFNSEESSSAFGALSLGKETRKVGEPILRINNNSSSGLPDSTLGRYLARRLLQVGVTDLFGVPVDSNLTLLDHLMAEPGMNFVGYCNELNAGYAADGYARSRGVGACVFTFTVGGLSALNAVAGAYSESIPLICIVGGPNSNYYGKNVVLHHTIGLTADFSQELKCFEAVTCHQAVVNNLEEAQEQIDTAITKALNESKPVYISISCNLPSISHPSFARKPVPFFRPPRHTFRFHHNHERRRISNPMCLEAAVEAAANFLNKAVKPVLIGGPKLRVANASQAFTQLADTSGYATAVMPAGKGLVAETLNQFIGTYWGAASSPFCGEIVETSDACLYVGPIFDDLNSVGYSTLFKKHKTIVVHPQRVIIADNESFGCVLMKDFLTALAKKVNRNTASYENYRMMYVPEGVPLLLKRNEALKVNVLFKHIERMLSHDSVVIADTGVSWFNCQKMKLPHGCGYEVQMLYASIGWSVGATLGYAFAAPDKRVIACIGDGSFQMTAQEVSTMIRYGHRSIIFLINNGGYTTEVQIHDGPYNVIKNWDYTGFVNAISNHQGRCWTAKVRCEEELEMAIDAAMGEHKESLCFIEVVVHKNDTSKELLELGTRLAAANGTPPSSRNW